MTRDAKLSNTVLSLYENFKMSFTPTLVIFPWLPTLATLKRATAGLRLYWIVSKIVSRRRKSGLREDDPLQEMIDRGDDVAKIIGVRLLQTPPTEANVSFVGHDGRPVWRSTK